MPPLKSCITFSQDKIQLIDWSLVSFFVAVREPAKHIAQPIAAKIAELILSISGFATIRMPIKLSPTARKWSGVGASPRNKLAISATQIGVENSNAKSCENCINITAKNYRFCPVKCAVLQSKWSQSWFVLIWLKLPTKNPICRTITSPKSEWKNIISNVLRSEANSRPDIAIRLNDSIAPAIHIAALSSCDNDILQ